MRQQENWSAKAVTGEDKAEQDGLRELLTYYRETKEAMTDPYERGLSISETRAPGVIHHARPGSMERSLNNKPCSGESG